MVEWVEIKEESISRPHDTAARKRAIAGAPMG
jgi:hypothetical protein